MSLCFSWPFDQGLFPRDKRWPRYDRARGIAQLVFERVEGEVEHSYNGAFADEFDYRGVS